MDEGKVTVHTAIIRPQKSSATQFRCQLQSGSSYSGYFSAPSFFSRMECIYTIMYIMYVRSLV